MPLWKKMLLLNFSENIASEMVAIDGLHNGWRHLVLPIAHTDDLVMDAVLAASALHLSTDDDDATGNHVPTQMARRYASMRLQQHPGSGSLYARAIKSLLHRRDLAASSALHQSFALLAILILLVAVMVSGSEDSSILLRMLHSAFEAIGGEDGLGTGALAEFMIRQIHKMRVYAAPLISEENGFQALSSQGQTEQVFECLNYCSQQRPDAAAAAPFIMSLVRQAHDIYLRQAVPLPSASDSTTLVQRFKHTLESFPHDLPGEQVLVWATFIAASDCVLDEHKAFFEDVFLRYFVRSGFRNVLRGLDQLRKIWARRSAGGGTRWTSVLPQAGVFVM
ncbi:hypothetical protein DBV05_g10694 [Lasiodiplodia theobromae]|uniref:Uncharacterized protein n=1 Tax=Lasiodiplodia theobromae TaxID=45133 RepID=A0A5N5CZ53_9PEZI|nr:hypothetical protein DBV05_g10694 [Lasiodiplodia theobromae]